MSSKNTTIEVKFTGDAKGLKSSAREAGTAVEDMADDVESAGKQMARALEQSAADMIREIDETADAVKAIEAALDGVDMDPQQIVADLKKLGLSANDVEAEAEQLVAALKSVDDVKIHAASKGFDDLDKALGRVDDNGRAASTAIGGIGNTVSELPGVGALGGMAESMGQLAEGALEGDIGLKSLVATGLGLGAVALIAKGITGHFEKIAAAKAFREDQVKAWTSALREGETLLGEINEQLAETGAIEMQGWDGVVNIVPILADAGVKVDAWTAAVEGNEAAQRSFLQSIKDGGAGEQQMLDITIALENGVRNHTAAVEANADVLAVQTDELSRTEQQTDNANAAVRRYEAGLRDQARATDNARIADERLKGQLSQQSAYLNLLDTFDAVEQAGQEAMAAVESGAADAEAKVRDYTQQQVRAKEEVIAFADEAGNVPEHVRTQMLADIDQGSLNNARRALDDVANPGGKARNAFITTTGRGRGIPMEASGTQSADGGPTWVGEQGPEIVNLKRGDTVEPAMQSEGIMRNRRSSGSSVTIIHYPSGVRPIPVTNAQRSYDRIQGPV